MTRLSKTPIVEFSIIDDWYMRYQTTVCVEEVGAYRFRFQCLEDFEKTVDALFLEFEQSGNSLMLEDYCPYFAVVWPGARVLARYILNLGAEAFQGRRVLEIGCGLALPSFVAARLGADVLATDAHPHVPLFLGQNLLMNPGVRLSFRCEDWRKAVPAQGVQYDWIVGSDILYDKGQESAILSLLRQRIAPQGTVLLLDPNRTYWERLARLAPQYGFAAHLHSIPPVTPQEPERSILIRLVRRTTFSGAAAE